MSVYFYNHINLATTSELHDNKTYFRASNKKALTNDSWQGNGKGKG